MDKKTRLLISTLIVGASLLASSCSDDSAMTAKAAELVAIKEAAEEQAAHEAAARLEKERLLREAKMAEQEILAERLAEEAAREAEEKVIRVQNAARELNRRQEVVKEARNFVDSIAIHERYIDDKFLGVDFNDQNIPAGHKMRSPNGITIKYLGKDDDYYKFAYEDDDILANFKRTKKGFSVGDKTYKTDLVPGISHARLKDLGVSISSLDLSARPLTSRESYNPGGSGHYAGRGYGLRILEAKYGAKQTWKDVKPFLDAKIANNKLSIRASSGELGGDPIFGEYKTLKVKYLWRGRVKEVSVSEGRTCSLPEN